jgi:hypothetical protein
LRRSTSVTLVVDAALLLVFAPLAVLAFRRA